VLRWLLLILLVLCVALQIKLWAGQGGRADVDRLRERVELQEAENARLKQRNDALAADVEDLKSGTDAIEERARGELGMIKPGEIFYQVVEEEPKANPQ
jgi:cell division protein FtsB